MDQDNKSSSFQLIDGNSTLNDAGLETFEKEVKLAECRIPYAAISIMGPQSSGKSTLLNHLFGTTFREMDTENTRGQTTQGIWLAKYPDVKRCTLVMDLEGSDGSERGEDDTTFEKQAALFAFAISDIVLINMWCHELGRENAASKPLLRTVFEVMRKLKLRDSKTTLWFVIRDKTKTPMKVLEEKVWKDIRQMWDSVAKGTPLGETFRVKITVLPHYEYMKEQFIKEVANLKHQLLGDLAGDWRDKRPSSGFSLSVKDLWEKIKENKDLDLPAHKIMVATVRCEEIANSTFDSLVKNEAWCQFRSDALSAPVKGFGKLVSEILEKHLLRYDADAKYFDEGVRTEKRKQLQDKLLQLVEPAWKSMLEHVHSDILHKFKEAFNKKLNEGGGFSAAARDCANSSISQFDEECLVATVEQASWDSSKFRKKLQNDIDEHVAVVRLSMLSDLLTKHKENLEAALSGPVETLLVRAGDDTWQDIRKLYSQEIQSFVNKFRTELLGFEEDEQIKNKSLEELRDYARGIIHAKAKQEAGRVLTCMKDRFERFFSHDFDSNMRVWNGEEDVPAITRNARTASLKLLSIMAAIRLDGDTDDIDKTLFRVFGGSNVRPKLSEPLASDTWEKVPRSETLITPVKSKDIWRQFNEFSKSIVNKALVNVDTIRCAAIVSKQLASFVKNQDWRRLEKDVKSHHVPDLWTKLKLIIDTCLSAYDVETKNFNEVLRTERRKQLEDILLQLACQSMFGHICSRTLDNFKDAFSEKLNGGEEFSVAVRDCKNSSIAQFDEECTGVFTVDDNEKANWEISKFGDKLQQDIDAHVAAVQSSKMSKFTTQYEEKLKKVLAGPVKTLLARAGDDNRQIRKLHAIQSYFNDFSTELSSFNVDEETKHKMLENLEDSAKGMIQANARQEAVTVLIHVKNRFEKKFSHDSKSNRRVYSGKEDALAIRETTDSAKLKLRSIMAAIHLDDDADDIEKIFSSASMDNYVSTHSDLRVPDTWGKDPFTNISINPVEINEYSEPIVNQAQEMVATVHCEAIACKKLVSFIAKENWRQLEKDVQSHLVPDLGKKLKLFLDTCLSEYDAETAKFREEVRTEKRRQLKDNFLLLVQPAFQSMLEHIYAGTLAKFKDAFNEKLGGGEELPVAARDCIKSFMNQFDEGCRDAIIEKENWDCSKLRDKLQHEFDFHVASIKSS